MSVNEIPTNFVLVKIDVNGVEKVVKIEKGCLFENNDIYNPMHLLKMFEHHSHLSCGYKTPECK